MLIIPMLINIFQLSYMSHYLAWYKWSIGINITINIHHSKQLAPTEDVVVIYIHMSANALCNEAESIEQRLFVNISRLIQANWTLCRTC